MYMICYISVIGEAEWTMVSGEDAMQISVSDLIEYGCTDVRVFHTDSEII